MTQLALEYVTPQISLSQSAFVDLVSASTANLDMMLQLVQDFKLTPEQAIGAVTALQLGEDLDEEVYGILFNHYCDKNEIPYGTATGKDGDPIQWVQDRVAEELGI